MDLDSFSGSNIKMWFEFPIQLDIQYGTWLIFDLQIPDVNKSTSKHNHTVTFIHKTQPFVMTRENVK